MEDIRDLREGTVYLPERCRYKVYIIDEVHMLSPSAWGALLKVMEEPPEYVKFILATTEVHKVPATIISRCASAMISTASALLTLRHGSPILPARRTCLSTRRRRS